MSTDAPQTVVARPRRARIVAWIAAIAIVAVFSFVATSLRGPVGAGPGYFQAGDQFAMVGLGVLGGLAVLLFTRPRVVADASGVRVRNLVASYDLPWEVVRAVRFGSGAPWATLDLQDDDVVAMMAIQAADKRHALVAVQGLRALHAAHRAAAGAPGPAGAAPPGPPAGPPPADAAPAG